MTGVTYDANHPFHLHGYQFRVVAMERLGNKTTVAEIKELERQGLIARKLKRAPLKDTVTVPDGGYTIVRFHADNPGGILILSMLIIIMQTDIFNLNNQKIIN